MKQSAIKRGVPVCAFNILSQSLIYYSLVLWKISQLARLVIILKPIGQIKLSLCQKSLKFKVY